MKAADIMNGRQKLNVLKQLCELNGVSGYETPVVKYLYELLRIPKYGKMHIDDVGNLIVFFPGKCTEKTILVQSHVDEVGFQVIGESGDGKYSIRSLGNIKTWNAYQQRVISSDGTIGIICARDSEQLKAYNYDNLFLEIPNKSKKICVGQTFTFAAPMIETSDYIVGKALDNRVSCSCLVDVISQNMVYKNDTYFCFTVQEEMTMRGARVLKSTLKPDVCINVDMSGIGERNSLKLGNGVGIKISDSVGISATECVENAKRIAECNCINYQLEVSDCGTSELIITNELDYGCKELGISIPCERLHCANTVVSKKDIDACTAYLPLLIQEI